MLTATNPTGVSFVQSVGVAPSTTTMELGNQKFYMPYASLEDLKASGASMNGLGLINESDAWLTGRPYGLPGTTAIRLTQRPGGYNSPDGYHYDASMLGGLGNSLNDADTQALTAQVQKLAEVQQGQGAALSKMAFWQGLVGGIFVVSAVLGVAVGVTTYVRNR